MVRVRVLFNNPIVAEEVQDDKLVCIFDKKQHAQTLLHNLIVMQDNDEGSLTDVVITSKDNKQFHFHGPILAALSKKLEEHLLQQGLGSAASKNSKIVLKENFSSEAIQCLWNYAYTSVVTLTPANINEVKELAEHYDLALLLKESEELLDRESFREGHEKEEVKFKDLPEIILNCLHDFLERKALCTAVIRDFSPSTRFQCHDAVIAAACTEFFSELSFGDSNNTIEVDHHTLQAMGPFLQYLYTAKLMIDQATVLPLIDFAVKFNMPSLGNACCDYFKFVLKTNTALGIKSIARDLQNNNKNLETESEDEASITSALADLYQYSRAFVLRNFLLVTESTQYLEISVEEVIDLVVDDDLCVHSEEEVFYAVMKWVCYRRETRAKDLPNFLQAVRLEYIPVDFLDTMLEHELMTSDSSCIQLIENAQTNRMSSRPRRSSIPQQNDV